MLYIYTPFSVYLFSLYSTITLNSCALLLQFLEIETALSPLPPLSSHVVGEGASIPKEGFYTTDRLVQV
jgi:hypothetical protein